METIVYMNIYCILEKNVCIWILTLNLAYLLSKSYDFGGTWECGTSHNLCFCLFQWDGRLWLWLRMSDRSAFLGGLIALGVVGVLMLGGCIMCKVCLVSRRMRRWFGVDKLIEGHSNNTDTAQNKGSIYNKVKSSPQELFDYIRLGWKVVMMGLDVEEGQLPGIVRVSGRLPRLS